MPIPDYPRQSLYNTSSKSSNLISFSAERTRRFIQSHTIELNYAWCKTKHLTARLHISESQLYRDLKELKDAGEIVIRHFHRGGRKGTLRLIFMAKDKDRIDEILEKNPPLETVGKKFVGSKSRANSESQVKAYENPEINQILDRSLITSEVNFEPISCSKTAKIERLFGTLSPSSHNIYNKPKEDRVVYTREKSIPPVFKRDLDKETISPDEETKLITIYGKGFYYRKKQNLEGTYEKLVKQQKFGTRYYLQGFAENLRAILLHDQQEKAHKKDLEEAKKKIRDTRVVEKNRRKMVLEDPILSKYYVLDNQGIKIDSGYMPKEVRRMFMDSGISQIPWLVYHDRDDDISWNGMLQKCRHGVQKILKTFGGNLYANL